LYFSQLFLSFKTYILNTYFIFFEYWKMLFKSWYQTHFFVLFTLKIHFLTTFFKPQFSHLFKQQFLNTITKRAHNLFQTLKWWQWKYKFFLPYILNPHLSTTINTICTSTIHLTFTLKIKNQSNISLQIKFPKKNLKKKNQEKNKILTTNSNGKF